MLRPGGDLGGCGHARSSGSLQVAVVSPRHDASVILPGEKMVGPGGNVGYPCQSGGHRSTAAPGHDGSRF